MILNFIPRCKNFDILDYPKLPYGSKEKRTHGHIKTFTAIIRIVLQIPYTVPYPVTPFHYFHVNECYMPNCGANCVFFLNFILAEQVNFCLDTRKSNKIVSDVHLFILLQLLATNWLAQVRTEYEKYCNVTELTIAKPMFSFNMCVPQHLFHWSI